MNFPIQKLDLGLIHINDIKVVMIPIPFIELSFTVKNLLTFNRFNIGHLSAFGDYFYRENHKYISPSLPTLLWIYHPF